MMKEVERSVIGMLLKMERLKQNKGQKEVCYGVCVTSYLSKIENGIVQADEEILVALFKKLGVTYERNQEKLKQYETFVQRYFYELEYGLEFQKIYEQMKNQCQGIEYSKYAVDWMLIQGYAGEEVLSFLEKIEDRMSPKQKAHFYILKVQKSYEELNNAKKEHKELRRQMQLEGQKAYEILRNSYSLIVFLNIHFLLGQYSMIHQNESNFIAMAVKEGNTFRLAEYYFIAGSAYACLNQEEMMIDCYERVFHLLQNTGWNTSNSELIDMMNYNLGATYISFKNYDKALTHLDKVSKKKQHSFSVLHKKAIAMIRLGEREEGRKILEEAKNSLLKFEDKYESNWLKYEEAKLECEENFLEDPAYLILIEKLIKQLEDEQHFGHLYFYHDVIIKAYTKQRKYKQALEFERKISSFIKKIIN